MIVIILHQHPSQPMLLFNKDAASELNTLLYCCACVLKCLISKLVCENNILYYMICVCNKIKCNMANGLAPPNTEEMVPLFVLMVVICLIWLKCFRTLTYGCLVEPKPRVCFVFSTLLLNTVCSVNPRYISPHPICLLLFFTQR